MPSPRESSTTTSISCTTPHLLSPFARPKHWSTLHLPYASKNAKTWTFLHVMPSKRKSVTFRENVSMICSQNFDGSTSPRPLTDTPVTGAQPLILDPMYLIWLRSATKAHYPFIVNGTFATHIYRQNFDEHVKIRDYKQMERAQMREAAVPFLTDRYGSLGWGALYKEEIYWFDGSDELLLEKIAEAYDEIKRTIAEEEKVRAQSAPPPHRSLYGPRSVRQWESYTQGGGALISPDFGPGGIGFTFDSATDGPFEDEGGHLRSTSRDRGGDGESVLFDVGVAGRGFGGAMWDAKTEVKVFGAVPHKAGWGVRQAGGSH